MNATADAWVVSHGKTAGVGWFADPRAWTLERGSEVVVETMRGVEVGTVLRPASPLQQRLLGPASAGQVLRPVNADDRRTLAQLHRLGQELFEAARAESVHRGWSLEILDIDLLLDRQAILQYLAPRDEDWSPLADALQQRFDVMVRFESLAVPADKPHVVGGCGKPDCGQGEGGGCSSCSSGGCSTCGSGVDLRAYFSHLRDQMPHRTPLL